MNKLKHDFFDIIKGGVGSGKRGHTTAKIERDKEQLEMFPKHHEEIKAKQENIANLNDAEGIDRSGRIKPKESKFFKFYINGKEIKQGMHIDDFAESGYKRVSRSDFSDGAKYEIV
jgi:hypothetical protein